MVCPLQAYLFGARPIPWTLYFVALSVATAVLDPWLAANSPSMPSAPVAGFFALNLFGVATSALVAAWYATAGRDRARRDLAEQHRLFGFERERSERLLLDILPVDIAERLEAGEDVIADGNPDVAVLFADLVGFTPLAERLGPEGVSDCSTTSSRLSTRSPISATRRWRRSRFTCGTGFAALPPIGVCPSGSGPTVGRWWPG